MQDMIDGRRRRTASGSRQVVTRPLLPRYATQIEHRTRKDGVDEAEPPGGLGPLLRYFLQLGTFGFGGPIATVGYMQRDLVERRHWLDRQEFLNGVALGQTMPGPLAAQVAMWVGYLRRGALGGAAISLPFIVPALVLVAGVRVA